MKVPALVMPHSEIVTKGKFKPLSTQTGFHNILIPSFKLLQLLASCCPLYVVFLWLKVSVISVSLGPNTGRLAADALD